MSSIINNFMISAGPDLYYDNDFRGCLEDHLDYFRNTSTTGMVAIKSSDALKYEGDLFGLLTNLKIATQYQWLIMRLNNYTSSNEYRLDRLTLLVPDFGVVDAIRQRYATSQRIA